MKYAPLETRIRIPSKVFLLGEYFCLEGAPALVGAIKPEFVYLNDRDEKLIMPAGSPAHRLLDAGSRDSLALDNVRRNGPQSGGLGASTADFLYAYRREKIRELSLDVVWNRYRACSFDPVGALPSGLDIAAQVVGGLHWFWIKKDQIEQQTASPRFFEREFSLHLFLAAHLPTQKTATHQELKKIDSSHRSAFLDWTERNSFGHSSIKSIEENLPDWMNRVALWSHKIKLEHSRTTEIREKFMSMDGVLAVKGCGARFSDVILIAVHRASSIDTLEKIRNTADEMKLLELGSLPEILAPGWREESV